jgi:hypothetical protein
MQKRFQKITATPKELAELKAGLYRCAAISMIHVTAEQAAATPVEVQESLWSQGVIGVYLGDGGLDCSNAWKAVGVIRSLIGSPASQLHDYADNLYRILKFQGQVGSSVVHSFSIAYRFLKRFRDLKGRWPTSVFEAGFGYDNLGQSLCCAFYGARYSGVTPEPGLSFPRHNLISVFQSLGLEVIDPDSFCDEVIFGTKMENANVRRTFELVYSHVVLEHVDDVVGFARRAYAITVPGGCFLSDIDLSGHTYGAAPWSFMELTDEEFERKKATEIGVSHRLKCEDWKNIFDGAGYKTSYVVTDRMTVPPELQARYPGKDITPLTAYFICRRDL